MGVRGLRWRYESSRLEGFSDAVFGFALTLLGGPVMATLSGWTYFLLWPVHFFHSRYSHRRREALSR